MLSLAKLGGGADAGRYYTDAVARGREDYYAGAGEAHGRWAGAGSSRLGLIGEVDEDDFAALMRGATPAGGAPLRQVQGTADTAGFDLTFSAPKSVSILYGVGDEQLARAVRDAHDSAVEQALSYLERETAYTRRGKAGRRRVAAEGLVVAQFRHRSSRAGDPQLHTHAVVANAVFAEGRWSALDARGLYAQQKTAGYLYKAALRAELTRSLGVSWGPVEKGSAETRGIPREVLEHFSRRRREITEHLAEHGHTSSAAAEVAALDTRRRKTYDVPADRLREEWRARAAEHGLDAAALRDVLARPLLERLPVDLEQAARSVGGIGGLTGRHAAFDRRDALRAWCEWHPSGASVERIEEVTDRWLASEHAVQLTSAADCKLRGPRYSTPHMLAVEGELLDSAAARRHERCAIAASGIVEAALRERPELTGEQQTLVRELTEGSGGVRLVRAAAGTGKTFALEAAHAAWRGSGLRVEGCALSARAAREMQEHTAIPSRTISQVRRGLDYEAPPDVLIVDEAAMAGTRDLHALARHAAAHGMALVLVGDDRQLPEIEAGGAFTALARRNSALTLTDVQRQREAWDREALRELRDGDHQAWASAYREHERIVTEPTAGRVRERLVRDRHRLAEDGSDAVMIAHRRADVDDLNARARELLQADGRLAPDGLVTTSGRGYAVGDRVICRRNQRDLDLLNGTRGHITAIDHGAHAITITDDAGRERTADQLYLDDGHLDHAYATTAHALQGATVDHALVLGSDDLYHQWAYTALSRHRESARFYLHADSQAEPLPGLEPERDEVAELLASLLARSREKSMARDLADLDLGP